MKTEKLFELDPQDKHKGKLNTLQAAQLQDCLKAGSTVKVGTVSNDRNKGWRDTPLFQPLIDESQPKLF